MFGEARQGSKRQVAGELCVFAPESNPFAVTQPPNKHGSPAVGERFLLRPNLQGSS